MKIIIEFHNFAPSISAIASQTSYDVIGVVNTHTPFSSASLISLLSKQTSSVARITHAVPTRLATAINVGI